MEKVYWLKVVTTSCKNCIELTCSIEVTEQAVCKYLYIYILFIQYKKYFAPGLCIYIITKIKRKKIQIL